MRIGLLAATLLLGTTGFAHAADVLVDEVAVADSAYNWSGAFIGAQIGYGWGSSPAPYGLDPGGPYEYFQEGPDQKGFVGGVFAGYNYQIDRVVLGVEADFQYSDIGGDDHQSGGDVNGLDANWQASARLKAGFAFDRFLPYVTGGVAFLNTDATAPYGAPNDTLNLTGWTVGVGLEYAITNNIIGKLDYRYADYGTKEASFPDLGYYEEYHPKHNIVQVGLGYKF